MKAKTGVFCLFILTALTFGHGNSRGTAVVEVEGGTVTIEYGRPSYGDRDISELPVGAEWRVGADKATTLTTETSLSFGGTALPAGTYQIKARHQGQGDWTLILSSGSETVEVPLTKKRLEEPVDLLTIELESQQTEVLLTISWGLNQLLTRFS